MQVDSGTHTHTERERDGDSQRQVEDGHKFLSWSISPPGRRENRSPVRTPWLLPRTLDCQKIYYGTRSRAKAYKKSSRNNCRNGPSGRFVSGINLREGVQYLPLLQGETYAAHTLGDHLEEADFVSAQTVFRVDHLLPLPTVFLFYLIIFFLVTSLYSLKSPARLGMKSMPKAAQTVTGC